MALAGLAPGLAAQAGTTSRTDIRASVDALPIHIDRGKHYPIGADGTPFLIHGDTAWSLFGDLPREDALVYLDDRHRRGFTAILASLLEFRYSRNAPRNAYGDAPFDAPGRIAGYNDAYFNHADWVIGEAEKRGIVLLLTPAYIGYPGANDGWYATMVASGVDALLDYGGFLGRRFGHRRNIIWVHAGDANPPDRSLISAIAEGIRKGAPGSLHTAHCANETMAVDIWGDKSWLDLNTLYTYQPVYLQATRAMTLARKMPGFLIESAYENEPGTGKPAADAHRVRVQAYQALLGGTCGHVFGNNPMWHLAGPGISDPPPSTWQAALGSPGAESMQIFKRVISGVKWWMLAPDTDFIVGGAGSEADRAVAAIASDRSWALAYGPTPRAITVALDKLGGNVSAQWIDPATGDSLDGSALSPAGGRRATLTVPTIKGRVPTDWLLVLRRLQ